MCALVLLTACGTHALAPGTAAPVALSATGVTDGVSLRLELDRATFAAGDVLWATLTIENTNDTAIRWVGGGCNVPGRVSARVSALADYGKAWDYAFASVKKMLTMTASYGSVPFLDEEAWQLRGRGGRACTADIRINELAAHGTLTSRWAWDGKADAKPVPSGDVAVTGSLEMDDAIHMVGKSVNASVTLPLTGGTAITVSAGEAMDSAMSDARFASWLRARVVQRGNSEPAPYDVTGSTRLDGNDWVINASQNTPPVGAIEVRVSGIDGSVRSVTER